MEGASLALSAVQTVLTALQCQDLRNVSSLFDYESQLTELKKTVSTVKAVLLDAETKEELSNETRDYVEKLMDAIYDADDLLDEFVTIAERRRLLKDGKPSEKVRHIFSRLKSFLGSSDMKKRVNEIQTKLKGIANNHKDFGLGINTQSTRKRKEETCSYVYESDVIGRKDDLEKIVGILNQNQQANLSFLSIVGIGGLGKTALAQLLFNDQRVTSAFPKRFWTCISDHGQEKFDVEGILRKILTAATENKQDGLPKEEVQKQLRRELASNKYLLVLDDVWTENHIHWLELVKYLRESQKGSWIVVTTRSEETARIIGSDVVHKLQGLSKEDSWSLFKKVAFGSEQANPEDGFVTVGEKIVQGCAGVPLALRVVGSLFYGQDESKWLSVQKMGVDNIRENQNDMMSILMISYHNLESPLKSCFSYCSLFPKDFKIQKDVLLRLWMAQGYVVPLDRGQNMEDAAEEYFSILLRRCFFQDVEKDEYSGEIYSCKIHDLMHDLAQKVSAKEFLVSDSLTDHIDEKVRHLSHIGHEAPKFSLPNKIHLRSYVQLQTYGYHRFRKVQHDLEALVKNLTSVRALCLSNSYVHNLPKSIGNLLHIRYLDLSDTSLVKFPESFIKLYNLETLILDGCPFLEELPKDIRKLVKLRVLSAKICESLTNVPGDLVKLINLRILDLNFCPFLTSMPSDLGNMVELRVLDVGECYRLSSMPSGLNKLTNLESLPVFHMSREARLWFGQLEELKALKNLKGVLRFYIPSPKNSKVNCKGGGYLKNKTKIHHVLYEFDRMQVDGTTGDTEEVLIEVLEPHCDVKKINIMFYHGVRMPSWLTSLSNLVHLKIYECKELQELTCLGKLHNLRSLTLQDLPKLEYIIERGTKDYYLSLFPSLVQLQFGNLPKLKGWGVRISDEDDLQLQLMCLTQLKSLVIVNCPELTIFPVCPVVGDLQLHDFNEKLDLSMDRQRDEKGEALKSEIGSESGRNPIIPKLRDVKIETDNMTWLLKSLTMESFQRVTTIEIRGDHETESWEAVKEVLIRHMKLSSLSINYCSKLGSVLEEEESGMPWQSINHPLRHLELNSLREMVNLPNWIRCLTSLETLEIKLCLKLESLPRWMSELSSLNKLHIANCSDELSERCQNPVGENWPYIQHIPQITIYNEGVAEK